MNLRLFLLIAMTALFGLLWSSDRQYQETQTALARAGHVEAAPPEIGPAVPVPPFAVSSWVAPSFAMPPIEEPIREPVVAPHIVQSAIPRTAAASPVATPPVATPPVATPAVAPQPMVSVVVLFRRPSFRFDEGPLLTASGTEQTAQQLNPSADFADLLRWAGRVRFEIEGQTCWMRWQLRRTAFSAQHRLLALVREETSRPSGWLDLVQKFARGALGPLEPAAENAAASRAAEKR